MTVATAKANKLPKCAICKSEFSPEWASQVVCHGCLGDPTGDITHQEQEHPRVEATPTAKAKSRPSGKRAPRCNKCGRDDSTATFFPSSPYICRDCHYEKQKQRRPRPIPEAVLTEAVNTLIQEPDIPPGIPEKVMESIKAPARTCIHCGAVFEGYKIGSQWAKRVCRKCLEIRKWKELTKAHAFSRSDAVVHLVFEGDDLELLERIRSQCKRDRRPIDQQLLFLIEKGLGPWTDSCLASSSA
jgi:hypothetical protein